MKPSSGNAGKVRAEPLRRLAGRLQGALSYSGVEEILEGDIVAYLRTIQAQCQEIHNTIYELYVDYSHPGRTGELVTLQS